jgi:membrane protein implicated in regulation of membrane protease activity
MQNDGPPPRRVTSDKQIQVGPGWFGRLLAVIVGAIVLVGAAMLSVILLAVLFAVGTIVAGYLWWKIRALRRQAGAFGDDGRTVDVEVVHKDSPGDDSPPR